jgi:hypothetical protein
MTRLLAALLLTAAFPLAAQEPSGPAPERPSWYIPLSAQERWDDYVRRSYSPKAVGVRVLRNGVTNLWSKQPPEWGSNMDAYGQRIASDVARSWVRRGIESGGAAVLGHDPRYIPCPCENPLKRVGHAFSQSILTYNNDGERVFGYARVGSRYAAEMIQLQWFPERYGWKDATREATQSFVSVGVFNVAREFWPDIKRKIKR